MGLRLPQGSALIWTFGTVAVLLGGVAQAGKPVPSADLTITKSRNVTTPTPGQSLSYTIAVSHATLGDPVTGATVLDIFPPTLDCTWTCSGTGGGTCTAGGSGDINDSAVDLPVGGSVTYFALCAIDPAARGSLVNTAEVISGVADPNQDNNTATDTAPLSPIAEVAITKTDGVATATPGGSVTYTISASNAGPSTATPTVTDTFPAVLTCTWTCAGVGGGTCTPAGVGNINDAVIMPPNGGVTYTATCAISASATGTLSNTAALVLAEADTFSGNDTATDVDTLTGVAAGEIPTLSSLGLLALAAALACLALALLKRRRI